MNFADTKVVLDGISDICRLENISITCENTDWKGRPYRSDYVILEAEHKIGFEVFENQIIAFYFGDHCHFENDSCESEDSGGSYVQRAIDFFRHFFTCTLQLLEKRKGRQLLRSEWFFLLPDGRKKSIAGQWSERLFSNPFVKPTIDLTNWRYFKTTGKFHFCSDDRSIVQVIQYDWDLLLEIHERDGRYTYTILQDTYNEDTGEFICIPAGPQGIHIFDTSEKAAKAAKEEAKVTKRHQILPLRSSAPSKK